MQLKNPKRINGLANHAKDKAITPIKKQHANLTFMSRVLI